MSVKSRTSDVVDAARPTLRFLRWKLAAFAPVPEEPEGPALTAAEVGDRAEEPDE
jgi:hypothetical protein